MRTFSEIVDTAIAITKQPFSLQLAIAATNAVVRDLSTNFNSDFDLLEHSIRLPRSRRAGAITQLRTASWRLPANFRAIRTVRYDGSYFPKCRKPGLIQKSMLRYWYQSTGHIHFSGVDHVVDIAYYKMLPSFVYAPEDLRLVRSDDGDSYLVTSNLDTANPAARVEVSINFEDASHEALLERHANWVIRMYPEIILDGVLSRLYNGKGDTNRGGRFHQQYSLGKDVVRRASEAHLQSEL